MEKWKKGNLIIYIGGSGETIFSSDKNLWNKWTFQSCFSDMWQQLGKSNCVGNNILFLSIWL